MKPISARLILLCLFTIATSHSTLAQDSQRFNGWPTNITGEELTNGFATPPAGYGNVPFFWLNGDSLRRDRMSAILDTLAKSATSGFSASYIHRSPEVDSIDHKKGYAMYGKTDPGKPELFSDTWWEFWNWFSGACAERGLGLGMDDYTLGWYGNGYYPDELFNQQKYRTYPGKLKITSYTVSGGETFTLELPDSTVSVVALPQNDRDNKPIDLAPSVANDTLTWSAPTDAKRYTVYVTNTQPAYLLHPDSGKELVEVYFDRFEQNMNAKGQDGMNYFFQDELSYPLTILSWSADMPEQFLARKGYDIRPYLPALKYDLGSITTKIRLDYCDVVMTLAEERYFKPQFDWNDSHGLIYGCDNLGRGLQPLQYLDYFRAMSWHTAPGNDAPARGSSFIQTKVSSSIAHLYNRPRTWLEAFHSMGWGSKTEWLTEQIDHHFMAGGNLVCLHGLYYSTHGGWWEWAPPSFHFRMPYWPHMKKWLEYTQRLSFILSQGYHVCDIAILYPTETLQAFSPEKIDQNYDFSYTTPLTNAGLDYDFIDSRSLLQCEIGNNALNINGESYKILLLKDIRAIRYDVLLKIRDFYRNGGIVIAIGQLPEASDLNGSNDPEVDKVVKEIFGMTAPQTETITTKAQKNPQGGLGMYMYDTKNLIPLIHRTVNVDFKPANGAGKILHRRTPDRDIYMAMNVKPGTECFFRSFGKVELWDAFNGSIQELPVTKVTDKGTYIRLNAPYNRSSLIVFSPGEPTLDTTPRTTPIMQDTLPIEGEWEVEMVPTLNNKWGDFRLPASDEMIGPEVRQFRYMPQKTLGKIKNWMQPTFNDESWPQATYGFGTPMEVLIDSSMQKVDGLAAAVANGSLKGWQPYSYSWQYGVENAPGSQGYHGLKGRLENNFLILDKSRNMLFRTHFYVPETGEYVLFTGNTEPNGIYIDNAPLQSEEITPVRTSDGQSETRRVLQLHKGWHTLLLIFINTTDRPDSQRPNKMVDLRPRSAAVLVALADSALRSHTPYDSVIGMKWAGHLLFTTQEGRPQKTVYRFKTAPGLMAMELHIAGKLDKAWVDGTEIEAKTNIEVIDDAGHYRIVMPTALPQTSSVTLLITPEIGFDGAAAFIEPIRLICSTGLMEAGDWSKNGALLHYSGGMYYRRNINLTETDIARGVELDLGKVVSSCEIKVNGQSAGILIHSPFKTDITPYLRPGENRIEILVYSTLANHYQTIPSLYKGDPEAGLIGQVQLLLNRPSSTLMPAPSSSTEGTTQSSNTATLSSKKGQNSSSVERKQSGRRGAPSSTSPGN